MRWCEGERAVSRRPARRSRPSASSGRSATPTSSAATTPRSVVDAPYTGFMHALVRARIPYLPVHADDIDRQAGRLTAADPAQRRRVVGRAGGERSAGSSSAADRCSRPARPASTPNGAMPRPDFALADLFALPPDRRAATTARRQDAAVPADPIGAFAPSPSGHTYLRLAPELRARVDGPRAGDEPAISGTRHPVLRGFDETDLLAFGGTLGPLKVDAGALVPLTFVPPFPTYPPETAWMRQPTTDIPGLVLSERGQSRVAYMPADIDRRYAGEHLPDHARLLANIVRWAAGEEHPADGRGYRSGRLPSVRAAGPRDPSPRQPDERGDLAGAGRRADSRRAIQDYHAAAAAGGQPRARLLVAETTRPVARLRRQSIARDFIDPRS